MAFLPSSQTYIFTFENLWTLDHLTNRNFYVERTVWNIQNELGQPNEKVCDGNRLFFLTKLEVSNYWCSLRFKWKR